MVEKAVDGKIAIVTGAGSRRGIGNFMALALVRAGALVAVVDRDERAIAERVSELREIGGRSCAAGVVADVSEPGQVERAVAKTIAELGGLHILINNAGTNPRAAGFSPTSRNFWDLPLEAWSRVVGVNLSGAFYMARAVTPHLIAQGWGRIIGVTTSLDTMQRKGVVPYGPSKAGHEAMVAIMAQDLDGTGVTANVLVPGGPTNTDFFADRSSSERAALIQPDVMQAPAVWLASEASGEWNGRRIIAYHWDERLPLAERLTKASAPAAWPQLGKQAIVPPRGG
jgi:NAD(P)-dependent dehydrogenase (short-subunit alcohol dehydrogenase family)